MVAVSSKLEDAFNFAPWRRTKNEVEMRRKVFEVDAKNQVKSMDKRERRSTCWPDSTAGGSYHNKEIKFFNYEIINHR